MSKKLLVVRTAKAIKATRVASSAVAIKATRATRVTEMVNAVRMTRAIRMTISVKAARTIIRVINFSINIMCAAILFYGTSLRAGSIRTLEMNDEKMKSIYLKMGQSTILRFHERPKKVVIGNQNYFQIEFIGNDVTIQPQGPMSTNLFVYGKYHTYGFILRVLSSGSKYDDLVKVRWRSSRSNAVYRKSRRSQKNGQRKVTNKTNKIHQRKKRSSSHQSISSPRQSISSAHQPTSYSHRTIPPSHGSAPLLQRPTPDRGLRIGIKRKIVGMISNIESLNHEGLYFIDIELWNISKKALKTSDIRLWMTRSGKALPQFESIFENHEIPVGQTQVCRIIFKIMENKGFSLHLGYQQETRRIIIKKRFL